MAAAGDKLDVKLELKWTGGDAYDATVTVRIVDSCYHERELKIGLPPGQVTIPEIEALTFSFTHDEGKTCSDLVKPVTKKIQILHSAGKSKVTAFAVVNGKVVGEDTKEFPRTK
jgi:hypothetical protein